MVDYTSILIGAVSVYAVLVHMVVAYLYAARQAGQDSVNATEAQVIEDQA
jgi:hypothetical protein